MVDDHAGVGSSLKDGLYRAIPIAINYLFIGIAAGVVGAELGLSTLEVFLLSLIVFAGSAQFSFATLYTGSLVTLVLSVFYINLRHVVYSLALGLQAHRLSPWTKAAIGAQLTDETFLVAHTALQYRQINNASWMFGINCTAHISWIIGNVVGSVSTGLVDFSRLGVDFAPQAMFLSLILLQVGNSRVGRQALAVSLVGAVAIIAAHLLGHGSLALVVIAPGVALIAALAFGAEPEDKALMLDRTDK